MPRDYPGDFETVEYILDRRNRATEGTFGCGVEQVALDSPVAEQHRNKVRLQAQAILGGALLHRERPGGARVLVLAWGGAADVQMVEHELAALGTHVVLVDQDADALALARLPRLAPKLTKVCRNVIRGLVAVRAHGPFDIVVAGGLFDYLADEVVVRGLQQARSTCSRPPSSACSPTSPREPVPRAELPGSESGRASAPRTDTRSTSYSHSLSALIETVLDTAMAAFTNDRTDIALPMAFAGLNLARKSLPEADWREAIQQAVAPHPLRAAVLEDPMTRRALEKPRGYAGDAVLLDYMYRLRPDDFADVAPSGVLVHKFLVEGPAPSAVRHRLGVLADALRQVGLRPEGAGRALAVACGHLRELSQVPSDEWPREIVALDQDQDSLAVVEATYPDSRVTPRRGTVRDVLARRIVGELFDLVYAAGLFDYLEQPIAAALTARMFDLVAPGGRLLIANFTPDTPDIGLMEAMLEWHLVYRAEADIFALLDGVVPLAGARTWRDPDGCIVYLEVERPALR